MHALTHIRAYIANTRLRSSSVLPLARGKLNIPLVNIPDVQDVQKSCQCRDRSFVYDVR
jgi:hypothetical protein